jgi:hypothetical protein
MLNRTDKSKFKNRRNNNKKGVALIVTMLTIVLILLLGISFLILAINQSSATMTDKDSLMALHLANGGVEIILNYLSVPTHWMADPGFGVPGLQMYSVIQTISELQSRSYPGISGAGISFRDFYITKLNRTPEAGTGVYHYDYDIDIGFRHGNQAGRMKLEDERTGDWNIKIRQEVLAAGQPPQYIITSTGRIYSPGSVLPRAVRQVEVRARERSALDNLYFFQNHQAYDRVATVAPPPNDVDFSSRMVGIDENTRIMGDVVVDGNSPFATHTAGRFQFFRTNNVNFFGRVSINQAKNDYLFSPPGGAAENSAMFHGAFLKNQKPKGLPSKEGYLNIDLDANGQISESEKGWAAILAQDTTSTGSTGYHKAFFRCGDNEGLAGISGMLSAAPGEIGHTANPQTSNPEWARGADLSKPVAADIEFDATRQNTAPGFARFIVEFTDVRGEGRVKISKRTPYTGRTVTLTNPEYVPITRFKHNLLYFEGGIVEVKGTCNGQMTVVAAENSVREPYAFKVHFEDGTSKQQSVHETNFGKIESAGKKITSVEPLYRPYYSTEKNTNNMYVHYNSLSEENRALTGENQGPVKLEDGRWVFVSGKDHDRAFINNPSPAYGGVYRPARREGMIVVADHIDYGSPNSSLGLIAQNWILLNKDGNKLVDNGDQITVRAALMSFQHSFQYDDVNIAGKDNRVITMTNGQIDFTGAIVSQFGDAEGKISNTEKRGYTTQNLTWDQQFRYVLPPFFPRWNVDAFDPAVIIEFVILAYEDKGSPVIQKTRY